MSDTSSRLKNNTLCVSNILNNIRELRKNKGISQKVLAEKLGMSTAGYGKIELGENVLSIERFLEICRILEVKSYNEILPQINLDSISRIELALMNAGSSFEVVKRNSMYAHRILDKLVEKLNDNTPPAKDEIKSELELVNLYFETLQREATRNGISLSDAKDLINNID